MDSTSESTLVSANPQHPTVSSPKSLEQDQLIEKQEKPASQIGYWKPFFLSGTAALGFAGTFAVFIVCLAVLFSQSQAHHGLVSANSRLHYLWTYGPTAIFTIVATCWGQVEYDAKKLAPWRAMAKERACPAKDGIFLDYISPWNVVVLFKALKSSQPVASLAVAGSLLINLLIVLSTGLLVSEALMIPLSDTPLVATSKFTDGSSFDPGAVTGEAYQMVSGITDWGLKSPVGTTAGYAYPIATGPDGSTYANSTINIETTVFNANMSCEILADNVTLTTSDLDSDLGFPAHEMSVTAPETETTVSCSGPDPSTNTLGCSNLKVSSASCDFPINYQMSYLTIESYRDETIEYLAPEFIYPFQCHRGGPADSVVVLMLTDPRTSHHKFEFDVTSLVCRPRYTMGVHPISLRGSRLTTDSLARLPINDDAQASLLGNVSAMDLWEGAFRSSKQVQQSIGFSGPLSTSTYPLGDLPMKASYLKDDVIRGFSSSAAQLARLYLMNPANEPIAGSVESNVQRLVARKFPFIFMEVVLAILICISLGIWFLSRQNLCPRDPGSIGGLATILARSPKMMDFFQGTATASLKSLLSATAKISYQTVSWEDRDHHHFSIVPSETSEGGNAQADPNSNDQSKWWQPFAFTIPGWVLTIILPVLLIVALEILYRYSNTHDGIVDIAAGEYIRYTWVYIPTLVMLGTGTLYGMLNFAAVVFQPYATLSRGGASAASTILLDLASKLPPVAFYSCLANREVAVSVTKMAAAASSLLTIATSGLYTAANTTSTQAVTLTQLDTFNTSDPMSEMVFPDENISNLPGIMAFENISYPAWSFEDFALPQLKMAGQPTPGNLSSVSNETTSLHARVPSMRTVMNCTMWREDELNVTVQPDDDFKALIHFAPLTPLPCEKGSEPYDPYQLGIGISSEETYFGQVSEYISGSETCPLLVIAFGRVDLKNSSNTKHSLAHCTPYLEQIDLDVTFIDPNYTIDSTRPPRPYPESAKVVASRQTLPFMAWQNLLSYYKSVDHAAQQFDEFFNALVYGKDHISPVDLLGPENADRLVDVTERFYAKIVAQVLNFMMRVPRSAEAPEKSINGSLDNDQARLFQSQISTRILQGVLGLMIVCALVAFFTMRNRNILPNNPCSIAAKAGLLAESHILSEEVIPPGSEWLNDKQLERNGTFERHRFKLGWWKGGRYGIDIESENEEDL